MDKKLAEILTHVEKPARYVGGEFNMPMMDKPCDTEVCLCFPDIYEIGMSNIGIRILYHMLNDMDGVICQRCFAPFPDMGDALRGADLPLFALETQKPLGTFDIVGFSIGYEMLYTNVLYMLDLANIPFRADARKDDAPLVIAGGPCSVNPEPFADFFDAIMIGDGEVNLKNFVAMYRECKKQGVSKKEFLALAAGLEGVYVPSLVGPVYGADGKRKGFSGSVRRAVVPSLEEAYFPTKILVPNIEITHDRAVLELYRGCSNGCRFCQACFFYRPIRARSPETLLRYAKELIAHTGYGEISLSSLSTGDYDGLCELMNDLKTQICYGNVKLSMPSLRLDSPAANVLGKGRLGSLTFAPEAGTQRLRDVINKNISDEHIENTVRLALEHGYNAIKLYFMIGLPTETDADLDGIAETVRYIRSLDYRYGNPKKPINISVSTSIFIPKPLTPFQWEAQIGFEEMKRRQHYLADRLKMKNVRYHYHDATVSVIEAVLARGDRSVAKAVERAYALGAKFDGWSEYFRYDVWMQAFSESGVEYENFTGEQDANATLPWEFIDNGVTRKYLLNERARAYESKTTPGCGKNDCRACGAAGLGACFQ